MSIHGEQVLLRVYLQSADRSPRTPTHERLFGMARQEGLAGATTVRGIYGYGARGVIKSSVFSIVEHVPVIVEIVDSAERIAWFVENCLGKLMVHGMATLERANVMMYRHRKHKTPQNPTDADKINSDETATEGVQSAQVSRQSGPASPAEAAAPESLSLGALLQPLSTVPRIQASENMKTNEPGVLLRVFIGESDRFEHRPLYEAIVRKARELGLGGATVLRGSAGFGASSVVHSSKLLEMSTDLPIVIEIVDSEEKIQLLLPSLDTMVQEGMITMEHVMILMYRHDATAK